MQPSFVNINRVLTSPWCFREVDFINFFIAPMLNFGLRKLGPHRDWDIYTRSGAIKKVMLYFLIYHFFHSGVMPCELSKTSNFGFCSITKKSLKGEFAVVPTDKICGRTLSSKIPVDINNIFMKLYITWPTWPKGHIPQKFEISKWFL